MLGDEKKALEYSKTLSITNYVVEVTIPLIGDDPTPSVLGTGTLFTHEDRYFIVTAAHILKADADDPSSADIDMLSIAYPSGRSKASLHTLGSFEICRPSSPSRVDVVVLELKEAETIARLKSGWRFLTFDQVVEFPFNTLFVVSGFPLEGASWDGTNVGQFFLTLTTQPLDYKPVIKFPELTDRFFYLQDEGQLLDGSFRTIPKLQGLSGASLWAYSEPSGWWSASKALKVVAVQSSYCRGKWIHCTDWAAVKCILDQLSFRSLPW